MHIHFGVLGVLLPILVRAAPASNDLERRLPAACTSQNGSNICSPGLAGNTTSHRSQKRAQQLQSDAAWYEFASASRLHVRGLARIAQKGKPTTMGTDEDGPDEFPRRAASQDWKFPFDDTWGDGVLVYVVDSGVWSGHSELTGRVEDGWVAPGLGGTATQDVCDHGTAVASLIAGTTLGVAKKATIVPVRIVDSSRCAPTPPDSTTDVVPGVNWAVSDFKGRSHAKAGIINISWQVYQTDASEKALSDAVAAGMHVVVSSGNDNQNQCFGGPATAALQRVKDVGQFVVGNTDWEDARFDLDLIGSNYGPCVTLFAPGVSMVVAGPASDGTNHPLNRGGVDYSGTSFAAPLVSGVIAAVVTTSGNMSPADMRTTVVHNAVQNAGISGLNGSPDIMLQSPLLSSTPQR